MEFTPLTRELLVHLHNGANPAITLDGVQAVYPVVRLVFKVAETDGFALAYGNNKSGTPHYDLSLVAEKLLTDSRNVARLPADVPAAASTDAQDFFAGIDNRYVFWAALALVVVVLLVVVARLLPKPAAEG